MDVVRADSVRFPEWLSWHVAVVLDSSAVVVEGLIANYSTYFATEYFLVHVEMKHLTRQDENLDPIHYLKDGPRWRDEGQLQEMARWLVDLSTIALTSSNPMSEDAGVGVSRYHEILLLKGNKSRSSASWISIHWGTIGDSAMPHFYPSTHSSLFALPCSLGNLE